MVPWGATKRSLAQAHLLLMLLKVDLQIYVLSLFGVMAVPIFSMTHLVLEAFVIEMKMDDRDE